MLLYEQERVALEQQVDECTSAVELDIAYTPVIAFPLTMEGIGIERMLDPVPVTKTEGGLYLVETPFHNMLLFGNPMSAEHLAPMRARFLVLKGWYDKYIDLLPIYDRNRVIAQFFDGAYLYLGPRIQYKKRGKVAPPALVEQWDREVERRARARSSAPDQQPITVRWTRPTPAEMRERLFVADPDCLPELLQKMPRAVIVDVRGNPPDVKELRARHGFRYFPQGSWWKSTKEGLTNPEGGFRQVLLLLEAGKYVVFYCSCNASRDQDERPCHRIQVRDFVLAALQKLECEAEEQRRATQAAIRDSGEHDGGEGPEPEETGEEN